MALSTPQAGSITRTFLCAADLSGLEGYIVGYTGAANTVELSTSVIGLVRAQCGVVVDGGTGAGTPVSVCMKGMARIKLGAGKTCNEGDTIAAGDTDDGKGASTTADTAIVIGRALEAGIANELILCEIEYRALGAQTA